MRINILFNSALIAGILVCFLSVNSLANILFLNDQNNNTVAVVIDDKQYPVESNGNVIINGKAYAVTDLQDSKNKNILSAVSSNTEQKPTETGLAESSFKLVPGMYQGNLRWPYSNNGNWDYRFVITKIAGERVWATYQFKRTDGFGRVEGNGEVDFEGILNGSSLKFNKVQAKGLELRKEILNSPLICEIGDKGGTITLNSSPDKQPFKTTAKLVSAGEGKPEAESKSDEPHNEIVDINSSFKPRTAWEGFIAPYNRKFRIGILQVQENMVRAVLDYQKMANNKEFGGAGAVFLTGTLDQTKTKITFADQSEHKGIFFGVSKEVVPLTLSLSNISNKVYLSNQSYNVEGSPVSFDSPWYFIQPNPELEKNASLDGKYTGLLQRLSCIGEAENSANKVIDEGYSEGRHWCDYDVLPGYQVWAKPYWYIWQEIDPEWQREKDYNEAVVYYNARLSSYKSVWVKNEENAKFLKKYPLTPTFEECYKTIAVSKGNELKKEDLDNCNEALQNHAEFNEALAYSTTVLDRYQREWVRNEENAKFLQEHPLTPTFNECYKTTVESKGNDLKEKDFEKCDVALQNHAKLMKKVIAQRQPAILFDELHLGEENTVEKVEDILIARGARLIDSDWFDKNNSIKRYAYDVSEVHFDFLDVSDVRLSNNSLAASLAQVFAEQKIENLIILGVKTDKGLIRKKVLLGKILIFIPPPPPELWHSVKVKHDIYRMKIGQIYGHPYDQDKWILDGGKSQLSLSFPAGANDLERISAMIIESFAIIYSNTKYAEIVDAAL